MSKSRGREPGQIIHKLVLISHFEAEHARINKEENHYSAVFKGIFKKISFGMKCAFCSGVGSFSSSPRVEGKD